MGVTMDDFSHNSRYLVVSSQDEALVEIAFLKYFGCIYHFLGNKQYI